MVFVCNADGQMRLLPIIAGCLVGILLPVVASSRLCALIHERHSIVLGFGRAMTNAILEMILNVSSRGRPCSDYHY